MGDYMCRECNDRGDCRFCSTSFEKNKVHLFCGFQWGQHTKDLFGWAVCPRPENERIDPVSEPAVASEPVLTERELADIEAHNIVRHIPDIIRDVTIWEPSPGHTTRGTLDVADFQGIVREVIAVYRRLNEVDKSDDVCSEACNCGS